MKVVILLSIFFSFSVFAENGKVIFTKGIVKIGKSKTLKKNQMIKTGDRITTGKSSLVVLQLPQGNKIKLGPESVLVIKSLPKKKAETTKLNLLKGSSFIKVLKGKLRKGQKSKLILRTRTAAMGVRGTEFFASYGSGDDIWMCVNEGVVAVKSKKEKKSTLVKEGEGIVVKDGTKTSKPKPLAWTRKLNWNMNPSSGNLVNKVSIESAYTDLLDQDYD